MHGLQQTHQVHEVAAELDIIKALFHEEFSSICKTNN